MRHQLRVILTVLQTNNIQVDISPTQGFGNYEILAKNQSERSKLLCSVMPQLIAQKFVQ